MDNVYTGTSSRICVWRDLESNRSTLVVSEETSNLVYFINLTSRVRTLTLIFTVDKINDKRLKGMGSF